MHKKLAAVAAGILMIASSVSSAKTLTTYNQIVNTLESGGSVFLNIKPQQCRVETSDGSKSVISKIGIKLTDLVEWENSGNNGVRMKAVGNQESGLFGNKKFDWFRTLTAVYEDGTVIIFSDHVDPATYDLTAREKIICKLTADNSGGVTVTELKS